MSPDRRQTSPPITRRAASRQRGSTYLLVLSMGTVLTVIGLAIGISGRIAARTTAAERDRAEAGVLAASGAELALATINSEEKWRVVRLNNAWAASVPLGDGTIGWKLRDETDDDLTDSFSDQIRICGEAAVGQSRRRFSMGAAPRPSTALPVLSRTLHSETLLVVDDTVTSSGGPLSTDGSLTNKSSITGDVLAAAVVNAGSIAGFVTAPAPGTEMPGSGVLSYYKSLATEISFNSLAGGNIKDVVLSRDSNPYGGRNAAGVYSLVVPTGKTTEIDDSIIQATLVIELQGNAKLVMRDKVFWEPSSTGMPSLVASAPDTSQIIVRPDAGTVSVPAFGINLLGIVVVVGTQATAPSELRGLFHVMGGAPTIFDRESKLIGSWITEGGVAIIKPTQFVHDPAIVANPPWGYTSYDTSVAAIPGSFRWESR